MSSIEKSCRFLQLALLMLVPGATVLAGACASTSTIECESGVRCPPGMVCVKGYDTCGSAEEVAACHGKAYGEICTYKGLPGFCVQGLCELQPCENASDCDDGNPCTDDVCNQGWCESRNSNAPCDDGVYCNGPDRCDEGKCVNLGEALCAEPTVCDEELRTCVGCQVDDHCQPPRVMGWSDCQGGDDTCALYGLRSRIVVSWQCMAPVCQEQVSFETEECTLSTNGNPCDDGSVCTVADACTGGICLGQTLDCDDQNPCTRDTCDSATGDCTHENEEYGTLCPGGNCDGQGSCVACTAAGVPCETGKSCEVGQWACLTINAPACMPVGPKPAGIECRWSEGTCDSPEYCDGVRPTCPDDDPVPDRTSCPDGQCMGGVCVP